LNQDRRVRIADKHAVLTVLKEQRVKGAAGRLRLQTCFGNRHKVQLEAHVAVASSVERRRQTGS
jgi:hypothetical protein